MSNIVELTEDRRTVHKIRRDINERRKKELLGEIPVVDPEAERKLLEAIFSEELKDPAQRAEMERIAKLAADSKYR